MPEFRRALIARASGDGAARRVTKGPWPEDPVIEGMNEFCGSDGWAITSVIPEWRGDDGSIALARDEFYEVRGR